MERRSQWNFLMADDGWRWKVVHPDGIEQEAAQAFAMLKDCTADATANGYVIWKPEEDRRHGR